MNLDHLMTIDDVAAHTGLSRRTIEAYRQGCIGSGDFPPPMFTIARSPVFDYTAICEWSDGRRGRGRPKPTTTSEDDVA